MKRSVKSRGIPFDEVRLHYLKNPKEADLALKIALKEFDEDGEISPLLDTLRLVARAQGGIAKLARTTSISRKSVHEALSADGNPRLRTFQTMLDALGLKMSLRKTRNQVVAR